MKTNEKTRKQKRLRKQMVEYLKDQRSKPGYSEKWTPGKTNDSRVAEMSKAKIGSASYETKGARKWRKVKEHLKIKSERRKKIDESV